MKKGEGNIRWYDRDSLEIVDEVLRATPKKIKDEEGNVTATLTHRKPSLTDARKQFFLPSVTSVIKDIVAARALTEWIEEDCIKTCAAYPYQGDGSEEDIHDRYMPMIKGKRQEYSSSVQDKGKLLHKEKELFFIEDIEPETMEGKNICIGYQKFMNMWGAKKENMTCEQPFGSSSIGFAGTPDDYFGDIRIINDLKTTKQKNFEKIKKSSHLYLSWKLQLGAYRKIDPEARLFQAVASQETGEVKFIELEDPDIWAKAFDGIFTTWCAQKEYDPRCAI